MEEQIKLSDLLALCLQCKFNSAEAENFTKLNEMLGKFIVRSYLPLVDKEITLLSIISVYEGAESFSDAIMRTEIGKVIFGLFAYIANLEVDIDYNALTYVVVDPLYELGVVDYILDFCRQDYSRLERMLQDALNASNVERIANLSGELSQEKLKNMTKELKEFKQELTPDFLEVIKQISGESPKEWKDLHDALGQAIYENSIKKNFKEIGETQDNTENTEDKTDFEA